MSKVTAEEKQETNIRIQKAAREIFLEKGIKGASIRDIAKKAGVGASTLYGYYSSKELLFINTILPSIESRNDLHVHLDGLDVSNMGIEEVAEVLTDAVFALPTSLIDMDQSIIKEFHSVLFSISASDEIKKTMENFLENNMKEIISNFIKRLLEENIMKVSIEADEFAMYVLNTMRIVFLEYIIMGDMTKNACKEKLRKTIRMSLIGKI
ncbi:TetR/AcrR family transcriptional regulator [Clostridia bacterium]|nr:TetR/AcrR family transcriptional regulator [Clostridia bacterium]